MPKASTQIVLAKLAKKPTARKSSKIPQPRFRKTKKSIQNPKNNRKSVSVNHYIETLMHPEITPGVKVPDLCTFPSGTFQLTYDTALALQAAGDSVHFRLNPGIQNPLSVQTNAAAAGPLGAPFGITWASQATVVAAYTSFRPVSAEMYCEFIGSTFNDQGYIGAYIVPREAADPQINGQITAALLALPFTRTYPLREGIRVIWKPEDNIDLEFKDVGVNAKFPLIGFYIVGAAVGSVPVKVRVAVNYEAIPKSDQISLINPSPSPVDLAQLQAAFNFTSNPYSSFSSFMSSVGNYVPSLDSVTSVAGNLAGRYVANTLGNAVGMYGSAHGGRSLISR